MPKKRLTDEGVRRLKVPDQKSVDLFDSVQRRLVMRASYGGAKTWRVRYYVGGKVRSYTLGHFPEMRVSAARDAAGAFLADPQKVLDAEREKKAAISKRDDLPLFDAVADDFLVRYVDKKGLRSEKEIRRVLKVYVRPRWKDRKFVEIRTSHVTALLDEIEDQNGPRQADTVLAYIRKMFRWYAARTDDYVAPTKPGMSRSNPTDRRRKRTLDDDEIRALWAATESKSTLNSFVRVLLLTAQRRGKVNHMKRADIKDGTWTIPSERREKGTAGALLLPQRALDIIEKQPIIAGNPYVFAASTGDGPFDSSTKGKLALDAVLRQTLPDMPRWTFHDLRRTARSLMSRAGVRPEIAERVLGHAQGELVETYDRYAYFDEKADAVRKVARLIDTIVNPPDATNIVPMTGRKRRSKARAS